MKKCLHAWQMDRAISYKCMNCDAQGMAYEGGVAAPVDHERLDRLRRENERRANIEIEQRVGRSLEIWRATQPGKDTKLARKYFDKRGLDVPDWLWPQIRFLPMSKFGTIGGIVLPALVLPFRSFDDPFKLVGVHRIALNQDGTNYRHNGDKVKISNGAIKGHGAIMLQRETDSLCVCEGFETALAVMMGEINEGAPVWATTGSEFLSEVPVIAGVTRLVIAADNDEHRAGQRAANRLSHVWRGFPDVTVVTNTPPRKGTDWADVHNRSEELDGAARATAKRSGATKTDRQQRGSISAQ